jgi:hypothetical protein
MFGTHFLNQLSMAFVVKVTDRVGAVQMERVHTSQLIPKLFEMYGSFGLSFRPQQGDHFSERGHLRLVCARRKPRFRNHTTDDLMKQLAVRPFIHHESGQCLSGIQRNEPTLLGSDSQINATAEKTLCKPVTVGLGGDDNAGITPAQSTADKPCQTIQQIGVIPVELNSVRVRLNLFQIRSWIHSALQMLQVQVCAHFSLREPLVLKTAQLN